MNLKKNIKKVLKEETNKFELVKNFIYTMFDNIIDLEESKKKDKEIFNIEIGVWFRVLKSIIFLLNNYNLAKYILWQI